MNIRTIGIALLVAGTVSACAPPRNAGGPSPQHGFETMGVGLGQLILSPLMIAAGLLEGIVTLPYFMAADLHALNQGMVESGAQVSVDRTYQYAYAQPLEQVPGDGDTGKVFRHMNEATRHFQRVLMGYGVEDYNRYVLTAVRTADRDGYTLYAVVHRPVGRIQVQDRSTGRQVQVGPGEDVYYRPYLRDAAGRPLDVVIDWAGVPRTSIRTQKGQAILMTIAANSVLMNRRSDGYWSAETRWISGEYAPIVAERKSYLDRRMGVSG
jgi:hypothetical protein